MQCGLSFGGGNGTLGFGGGLVVSGKLGSTEWWAPGIASLMRSSFGIRTRVMMAELDRVGEEREELSQNPSKQASDGRKRRVMVEMEHEGALRMTKRKGRIMNSIP